MNNFELIQLEGKVILKFGIDGLTAPSFKELYKMLDTIKSGIKEKEIDLKRQSKAYSNINSTMKRIGLK